MLEAQREVGGLGCDIECSLGGGGGEGTHHVMHGLSRMTIGPHIRTMAAGRSRMATDPSIPTMPGDGARRPFTDQADIACTKREAL